MKCTHFHYSHLFIVLISTFCISMPSPSVARQEAKTKQDGAEDAIKLIEQAAENIAGKQRFVLRYKFKPADVLRWNVEHTASTKTQVSGVSQETSSRSQSVKKWKVTNVDDKGNMTFEHMVESASLWQKIGDQEPLAYDSTQPENGTPPEFQNVPDDIGVVISTITASPSGRILNRKSDRKQTKFGVGEILIPLPESEVAIGHKWFVPTQYQVTDEAGLVQFLSARIMYELDKVIDNKAYISIRTQVLTPITSDKVRSQLMQQLNSGYAVLDLEKGVIVQKEFDWNEKVQGYQGPDSFLEYLAKMTERQIVESPTRVEKVSDAERSSLTLKTRDGKPVIRK